MNWRFTVLIVFAVLLVQSEAKPLLLDADYTDNDLVAEESQSFAHASSSAFGGAGASASSSSTSFGGFGFGSAPLCHFPQQYPIHHHHIHQPAPFGPFFPQPGFGHSYFPPGPPPPQIPPRGKQPKFNERPVPVPMTPLYPMQPARPIPNNNKKPMSMPPGPAKMPLPTSNVPPQPLPPNPTMAPIQPSDSSSFKPMVLPLSSPPPIDVGATSTTKTTTEEPFYDIDIRFNNK